MGLFIDGVLAGVEFVVSGKFEDGKSYGASVKLKFHEHEKISKFVEGTSIEQNTTRTTIVAINCLDAEIISLKTKYDAKIGKHLKLRLEPADNSRFKLLEDESDKAPAKSQSNS